MLTPVVAVLAGAKLAVAAVSVPHAIGTSIRFWRFRQHVDWRIVRSFGLTSAAGGLTGALLNSWVTSRALEIVFNRCSSWRGGAGDGLCATMASSRHARVAGRSTVGIFRWVGRESGGIRTAAMLGFEVDKRQFVATTTAVALLIDMARVPVYLALEAGADCAPVAHDRTRYSRRGRGTIFGEQLLARVPELRFRSVVGVLILLLGLSFFIG